MQTNYETTNARVQVAKAEFHRAYSELVKAQGRFKHAVGSLEYALRERAKAYERQGQ